MTQITCIIRVMNRYRGSVDNRMLDRIRRHGGGWVFTPADFQDLGSRDAVASALKRYKADRTIRHLARGLYDVPRSHPNFPAAWPSLDAVVSALQSRDGLRVQPSGAYAAHMLGLSDQVPMRVSFLTDGPARRLSLGNLNITLKPTTPRNMATAGRVSGNVIQALRWLGKDRVDDRTVKKLQASLDDTAKSQLVGDLRYAPAWISDVMRRVSSSSQTTSSR